MASTRMSSVHGPWGGSEQARTISLRVRKPCRRTMSGFNAGPIRTGPPAQFSINATRRRMSARMILSPSSASAMMTPRRRSGGK